MENGTKLRILYLYQHLVQHTDAEHTLSTAELMKILKEVYSVKVSRNTIRDDLAILHDCGLHIEHYESTQNKYYYDGHIYELPELKVLVYAVASSKFITQRKSDELIAKLLTLTNSQNAVKLRRHRYSKVCAPAFHKTFHNLILGRRYNTVIGTIRSVIKRKSPMTRRVAALQQFLS